MTPMTYTAARAHAVAALSMPETSKERMIRWNWLEDQLNALPVDEAIAIYNRARKAETMPDFALVCMLEG